MTERTGKMDTKMFPNGFQNGTKMKTKSIQNRALDLQGPPRTSRDGENPSVFANSTVAFVDVNEENGGRDAKTLGCFC